MEKLIGINNRDKFRIRYYNDNLDLIKLEKKSKINGLCLKITEPISKEECEKLIQGNIEILKTSSKKLFNELYVKMKNQFLKPKTIVDYTREAYIYKAGNVRITFDKKIRTGIWNIDFLNILAVTSNVVLSLGMVGALSIVRFRSAVKEPIDIAYLFWGMFWGQDLLV